MEMFDFFLRRTETESRVARDGHLGTGSPRVRISSQSLKVSSFPMNTRTTTRSHFSAQLTIDRKTRFVVIEVF